MNGEDLSILSGLGDAASILAAGQAIGNARRMGEYGIPYHIIPEGYKFESLESTLQAPSRKRGTIKLRDAKSFIAYFKKHQMGSCIYGTVKPARFVALLDDHRNDEPGWREHRAIYECPLSAEWQTWQAGNRKPMKQAEFAQFIEDNLPDIVEPSGADMLEISRTLEAKKKINFASGIRLSNGQQELTYEEEIQGTASKGKLQIPELFTLGISVLEGGARYKVEARLRYRIDGGNLVMWYDLLRAHKVHEDAIMEVWRAIQSETKTDIFHGEP